MKMMVFLWEGDWELGDECACVVEIELPKKLKGKRLGGVRAAVLINEDRCDEPMHFSLSGRLVSESGKANERGEIVAA